MYIVVSVYNTTCYLTAMYLLLYVTRMLYCSICLQYSKFKLFCVEYNILCRCLSRLYDCHVVVIYDMLCSLLLCASVRAEVRRSFITTTVRD